ncbi:putative sulfate exporter family transporter [Phenylobacterium sp.]|uniref:YeiH family protein n=1 Tax=Phenylobacterium sp. TaxID=1871053 RepID=UPI00301C1C74
MRPATPPEPALDTASGWLGLARLHAPGVVLTLIITWAAFGLRTVESLQALSPLILAMILGMAIRNLIGVPDAARMGVVFSQRRLLRMAIVLLGLQFTIGQIALIGLPGLGVAVAALGATFLFSLWLGRLLGIERGFAVLIAGGVSVCGASAITAFNTVVRADDEDAAYAVAAITAFGALAMFAFPLAPALLDLTPRAYGVWTGAAVHEIAQVAGAGFQNGPAAGEAAMVTKLSRVVLLAPLVLVFAWASRRTWASGGAGPSAAAAPPWFLFGFMGAVAFASLIPLPSLIVKTSAELVTFLMTMALAAMGLEVDVTRLKRKGVRPLVLAGAASLFIAGLSLGLVKAWGV